MTGGSLPHFIDSACYSPVFTTQELLGFEDIPLRRLHFQKGENIFMSEQHDDYMYHLVEGIVKLYLSSSGGLTKTLFFHGPGTQFGFQGFEEERLTLSTAIAMTDATILAIHYDDLLAFCDRNTRYYLRFIVYLKEVLNSATNEVANFAFESGTRRFARLLYALTVSMDSMPVFTIDDFAEMLGVHRNTVSNALTALRRQGLIDEKSKPVRVRDLEGLKAFIDDGGL